MRIFDNIKRKTKQVLVLVAVVFTVLLSGCASNATIEGMTYVAKPTDNKQLMGKIIVSDVNGGKETNPILSSQVNNENLQAALVISLKHAKLYSTSGNAKYKLLATLEKLEQPILGFNMSVRAAVQYKLISLRDKKAVWHKLISNIYTAQFSDALYGVTRLRLANEGAIRKNIELLIEDLNELKLKDAQIALSASSI